jgi:hypothetical protein
MPALTSASSFARSSSTRRGTIAWGRGTIAWGERYGNRSLLLSFGAALLIGCASGAHEAVRYSGAEYAASQAPLDLVAVPSLPDGFESFGRVRASCQVYEAGASVEERRLVDLDCSAGRLQRALREKAAAVGAELLVRERCGWATASHDTGVHGSSPSAGPLICRAQVARVNADRRSSEPLNMKQNGAKSPQLAATAREAAWLDDPTGEAAWSIRVSFVPVNGDEALKPSQARLLPAGAVGELTDLPPSHRPLGTVVSECPRGCTEGEMRASLRVAAGRLGASDVVGPRCVPSGAGWHCVGTLARLQVDH